MPEPFKNKFDAALIQNLGEALRGPIPDFDVPGFCAQASKDLDRLELKARSNQIAEALVTFMPKDFAHATDCLIQTLQPLDAGEDAPGQHG